MPNAEVWKQLNQRFAPNVSIFQQNVRANLVNFIQGHFWDVSFSNEDFKTVEEGLGDHRDLNLSVSGSNQDDAQGGGEVRFRSSRHLRVLFFIAVEPQKLDKQKYISLESSFYKLIINTTFRHLRGVCKTLS